MKNFVCGSALGALLLSGCAPSAPRLFSPDSVDAYCGTRTPLSTAIESVVASADDRLETPPVPSTNEILTKVKKSTGVIAHWKNQQLLLPKTAQALGYAGRYVRLLNAAITDRLAGADSRRIYLTVELNDGSRKTLAMRAFDTQDICNEGKLSP